MNYILFEIFVLGKDESDCYYSSIQMISKYLTNYFKTLEIYNYLYNQYMSQCYKLFRYLFETIILD